MPRSPRFVQPPAGLSFITPKSNGGDTAIALGCQFERTILRLNVHVLETLV